MSEVIRLGIGEVCASARGAQVVCYGLGSCVGLFLYDLRHRIGGGAHIFLPKFCKSSHLSPTHFAQGAVEVLLHDMCKLGGQARGLRAYLFGGARLFAFSQDVGQRNVAAVQELLQRHKIFLAYKAVGGHLPVSVSFHTGAGSFRFVTPNLNKIISPWPNVS